MGQKCTTIRRATRNGLILNKMDQLLYEVLCVIRSSHYSLSNHLLLLRSLSTEPRPIDYYCLRILLVWQLIEWLIQD